MRREMLLFAMLLGACGSEAPPLHILSLQPTEQSTIEWNTVTIELDAEPPLWLDYGRRTAGPGSLPMLRIGPRTMELTRYLGQGRYEALVGPGLPVGVHDVQVRLVDGREAVRPEAYRVRPSLNHWIETVPDQLQGEPFTLTLRVAGADGATFDGSVTVSINKGQLLAPNNTRTTSFRTGPFSGGVRQEVVSIDTPASDLLFMVQDDEGRRAWSNAFRVTPR